LLAADSRLSSAPESEDGSRQPASTLVEKPRLFVNIGR
jgi:hypothetical protein